MLTFSCRWLSRRGNEKGGSWQRTGMFGHCLSPLRHWPARLSHPVSEFAGKPRAWDCRHRRWGGDRREGKPAWSSSILNLFVPLWVGEKISLIFFPFEIISHSLSTDDFVLISWGQAIGSANTQILVSGKFETGFRKNRWVEWGWSPLKIISKWIQSWVNTASCHPHICWTFVNDKLVVYGNR